MSRVTAPDIPGSLFKRPQPIRRREKDPDRDPVHLAAIRMLPCLACGRDPCGEAAHVRMGSLAGMGRKPPDRLTVPLCHECHMTQHSCGELSFYADLGIAPTILADRLYGVSPNIAKMRAMVMEARRI